MISKETALSSLRQALLTVPEAAFVAGVPDRFIQGEIDHHILESVLRDGRRTVRGGDLLYLNAVSRYHAQMGLEFRRDVCRAIRYSVEHKQPEAWLSPFCVSIAEIQATVTKALAALDRMKRDHTESRPEVLGGEPVLKGTRLSLRFIADLAAQGATTEELMDDFDLTKQQVEAAVILARINARRGRPAARR